jgi:hypothetical protein
LVIVLCGRRSTDNGLAGAAHRLGEDVDFDCAEAAVRLRHCGHFDKRVLFDVGERRFDDAGDLRVIGDGQF